MGIIERLLDLLFPPRCVFCRRFLEDSEQLVCPDCLASLPRTGAEWARSGDDFSVCCAALYYEGDVRESLHRYKFDGFLHYAEPYGALLAACLSEHLAGRWDVITWVPVSPRRLRERGYDQAKLLAEATAEELGEDALPALRKLRHTQRQALTGGAAERRGNVAGAYAVSAPENVTGRRVLLIDDIVTTGATLSECARTLRDAGAAEVVCAALARGRNIHEQ